MVLVSVVGGKRHSCQWSAPISSSSFVLSCVWYAVLKCSSSSSPLHASLSFIHTRSVRVTSHTHSFTRVCSSGHSAFPLNCLNLCVQIPNHLLACIHVLPIFPIVLIGLPIDCCSESLDNTYSLPSHHTQPPKLTHTASLSYHLISRVVRRATVTSH